MFTQLLAEDRELITYRKNLNKITGSVLSTILLQQAIYWSSKKDGEPFYKFKQPCKHNLYNDGDSWTEELGFSLSEFDIALKKIATKSTKGTNKKELMNPIQLDADKLIIYWTDSSRVTWYWLNRDLLDKLLSSIYLDKPRLQDSKVNVKTDLPLTETTTKTTTDIYTPPKNSKTQTLADFDDGSDLAANITNKQKFVSAFTDALRPVTPAERLTIGEIGQHPGSDLTRWKLAIKECAINFTGRRVTVAIVEEVYNAGGTWAARIAKLNEREAAAEQTEKIKVVY